MRRIVVFDNVTADGYFAASDGALDWVVPDPELNRSNASGLDEPGTILFGRRTYEMFESFWPRAVEGDPGARSARDPHDGGALSPEMRAMGVWINEATKIVFSRTRKDVTWRNSSLRRELDPRAVEALKREPGRDIMLFGSGSIVSQLAAHGLVDEYQLVVNPLLLGGGRTLVNGLTWRVPLTLREARAYPSGNVMLRYAPRG